MVHWLPAILSTTPMKAAGMGCTALPALVVGMATPPQALRITVEIVKTKSRKCEVFFIIYLIFLVSPK
jgi:hypothetical protein